MFAIILDKATTKTANTIYVINKTTNNLAYGSSKYSNAKEHEQQQQSLGCSQNRQQQTIRRPIFVHEQYSRLWILESRAKYQLSIEFDFLLS